MSNFNNEENENAWTILIRAASLDSIENRYSAEYLSRRDRRKRNRSLTRLDASGGSSDRSAESENADTSCGGLSRRDSATDSNRSFYSAIYACRLIGVARGEYWPRDNEPISIVLMAALRKYIHA